MPPWSPAKRVGFRFVFAYSVLYLLPFPVPELPAYDSLWQAIVPWVGKRVLHLGQDITVFPNGSGDTTFNYVQVLCFVALAAAVTLVWTALDSKRLGYARLNEWLRLYLRFALGSILIGYGSFKVIQSQFPFPTLSRLVQQFGEASPMGLLWAFMGFSASYNAFTGAGEMLGGVLLFARRTTTLGALVSIGVLSHIVVLNFSYDVPVKLFSCHLLAMALFLVGSDARRLADLFLFNRPVAAVELRPLFSRTSWNRAAFFLGSLFLLYTLVASLRQSHEQAQQYGPAAPKPPLYGIYRVLEFARDGQPRPPLLTDAGQWKQVVFGEFKRVTVRKMDDEVLRYTVEVDAAEKTVTLSPAAEGAPKVVLAYTEPEVGQVTLEGSFEDQAIRVRLGRVDHSKGLLLSRGFHWVSEYPFNR